MTDQTSLSARDASLLALVVQRFRNGKRGEQLTEGFKFDDPRSEDHVPTVLAWWERQGRPLGVDLPSLPGMKLVNRGVSRKKGKR